MKKKIKKQEPLQCIAWELILTWNDGKKESWTSLDEYMNSQDVDEGIAEYEGKLNKKTTDEDFDPEWDSLTERDKGAFVR